MKNIEPKIVGGGHTFTTLSWLTAQGNSESKLLHNVVTMICMHLCKRVKFDNNDVDVTLDQSK